MKKQLIFIIILSVFCVNLLFVSGFNQPAGLVNHYIVNESFFTAKYKIGSKTQILSRTGFSLDENTTIPVGGKFNTSIINSTNESIVFQLQNDTNTLENNEINPIIINSSEMVANGSSDFISIGFSNIELDSILSTNDSALSIGYWPYFLQNQSLIEEILTEWKMNPDDMGFEGLDSVITSDLIEDNKTNQIGLTFSFNGSSNDNFTEMPINLDFLYEMRIFWDSETGSLLGYNIKADFEGAYARLFSVRMIMEIEIVRDDFFIPELKETPGFTGFYVISAIITVFYLKKKKS